MAAAGETSNAIQAFLIDTAGGELQVWTQPWEPPAQWEEYERTVAGAEGTASVPVFRWQIVTHGLGIGVRARF